MEKTSFEAMKQTAEENKDEGIKKYRMSILRKGKYTHTLYNNISLLDFNILHRKTTHQRP